MNLTENIRLALRVIVGNKLRSALTITIIMLGIMALIGILTASEGMRINIEGNFSEMGSNTFTVRAEGAVRSRGPGKRKTDHPPITLQQVNSFKQNYKYPSVISASCNANTNAIITRESKKTNPNVVVVGVDENYLKVTGTNIDQGRNFSKAEIDNGSNVVLLGKDVISKVFDERDSVIGNTVNIQSKKYKVIGILASKGANQSSSDNQAIIPLQNARYSFPADDRSYALSVMVNSAEEVDRAVDEAIGILRGIRKLRLNFENNFDIMKSQRLVEQALEIFGYIKLVTVAIGILTLIGAGIGLMNIMLVSVNERTREIGISKALGATKRVIRIQFLTEAIVICQIGGILGIILGILIGNFIGIFLKTGFIFPVFWVIGGVIFTFIVGLSAGLYPAYKAADLDPVEALRYE
ncbi:MAG: ABC transporter permease [Bacteroidetes bacterium]|nr:ABC transporter permease [Bacteroidota bacterium]